MENAEVAGTLGPEHAGPGLAENALLSAFVIGPLDDARMAGYRRPAAVRDPLQPALRASRDRIHLEACSGEEATSQNV